MMAEGYGMMQLPGNNNCLLLKDWQEDSGWQQKIHFLFFYFAVSFADCLLKNQNTMGIMIGIDTVLLLILILLIVVKTVHFFKYIKHRRLLDWFYFNRYNIILSSTPESAEAKKKQNNYTLIIGIMILVICFAVYLEVLLLM